MTKEETLSTSTELTELEQLIWSEIYRAVFPVTKGEHAATAFEADQGIEVTREEVRDLQYGSLDFEEARLWASAYGLTIASIEQGTDPSYWRILARTRADIALRGLRERKPKPVPQVSEAEKVRALKEFVDSDLMRFLSMLEGMGVSYQKDEIETLRFTTERPGSVGILPNLTRVSVRGHFRSASDLLVYFDSAGHMIEMRADMLIGPLYSLRAQELWKQLGKPREEEPRQARP